MSSGAAAPLRPVGLQELQQQPEGRHWAIDQPVQGIESLTPVRGELTARHLGTVLELQGRAETIVTRCCDRCLQSFNQPVAFEVHEVLELATQAEAEGLPCLAGGPLDAQLIPPGGEDLDDRLDPRGSFDPEAWVFEQLSLHLPQIARCGRHCPGPATWSSAADGTDPRWAALRTLRPS